MILSALDLTEETVFNKYAKHAVQSKIKEQAQRRVKSSTKSPPTSGKAKTTASGNTSTSSKQAKRRKTRKKTTDIVKEKKEKTTTTLTCMERPITSKKKDTKTKRWETYTN